MRKIKLYFKRIYRLSLKFQRQEALLWNDLKKFHANSEWRYGIYEKEKYIETVFELGEEKPGTFYYMIYDGCCHCRVKILENFPTELTTEFFLLAAHFNNLLKNGVVVINVKDNYVEFLLKREMLIPLLYYGEIHEQMILHYNISKDVYWAYQRLLNENEAPAIIIGDLLKKNESKDEK